MKETRYGLELKAKTLRKSKTCTQGTFDYIFILSAHAMCRLNPKEACEGFLYHGEYWVEPNVLIKQGVEVFKVRRTEFMLHSSNYLFQTECNKGEAVVIMPNRIHYGFSPETNVSESFPWQPEVENWIEEYTVW
jgi:hypothetical protein